MMKINTARSILKIIVLVMVPLLVAFLLRECSAASYEHKRLADNQDILLHNGEVGIGRTPSGKSVASSAALHLTASELRRKPDSLLAKTMKELKIKSSRVVAASGASSSTSVDVAAAIATDSLPAIRHVEWSDPWVRMHGTIEGDTFRAHIESRDTLQMIVHRVPKRFLFFRFGTKAVRMEVVSQNPHTTLCYPKLIFVH